LKVFSVMGNLFKKWTLNSNENTVHER
jgi:hypothetical protein